jgi:hypothetical protein
VHEHFFPESRIAMDKNTQIIFIIFTAVTAISVVIQGCAILGMFLAGRKAQKEVHALIEDFRVHILPIVSSSRALVEDLSPKVKVITTNLVDSSASVRTMAQEVSSVVGEVAERTRAQAAHVDGMVQGTLEHINHAGSTIQHGISVPLRQLNGIFNALRAAVNVIVSRAPRSRINPVEPEDEALFD